MHHVSDGLYFGRMLDGSVRIIKFKSPPLEFPRTSNHYPAHLVEYDQVIPAPAWASLVASVSLQGEERGRFYEAQAFHMNPKPKEE